MTDERQERAMTQPDVRQQIAQALETITTRIAVERSAVDHGVSTLSLPMRELEQAEDAMVAALSLIQQQEAELARLSAEHRQMREKYHELLFEVATKHPDESRHETARRYIRERETRHQEACEAPRAPEGREGER